MQNFSIHEKLMERDLQIMDMSDFYRINLLHNYHKRLVVPRQCWPCAIGLLTEKKRKFQCLPSYSMLNWIAILKPLVTLKWSKNLQNII